MSYKHGMFGTKVYSSWAAMLYRCRNPRAKAFANYGGRGVTVCDRWHEFSNFYEDMGKTHWDGAEIDRIDPDGNYEPDNCRWVTSTDNARNKRNTLFVTHNGERQKLVELCAQYGVPRKNVLARLQKGWDLDKALTNPVGAKLRNFYEVGGERLTVRQMSERYGLTINTIRGRLHRGWTIQKALGIEA